MVALRPSPLPAAVSRKRLLCLSRAGQTLCVTVALIASILAVAGDVILIAAANAGQPDVAWVPVPSDAVLVLGTYIGLLAIPCYALGYRDAGLRLDSRYGQPLARFGTAGAVLGGTTHALSGLAIHVERTSGMTGGDFATVVARQSAYLGPIWILVTILSVAAAYFFTAGVIRGRSSLPAWMAAANPLFVTLAVSLLSMPCAFGRLFLIPMAPNLSHVVFFALLASSTTRR